MNIYRVLFMQKFLCVMTGKPLSAPSIWITEVYIIILNALRIYTVLTVLKILKRIINPY